MCVFLSAESKIWKFWIPSHLKALGQVRAPSLEPFIFLLSLSLCLFSIFKFGPSALVLRTHINHLPFLSLKKTLSLSLKFESGSTAFRPKPYFSRSRFFLYLSLSICFWFFVLLFFFSELPTMRKGAKRKTSHKEETNSAQDNNNHKDSKKAITRAKRVKASKPQTEPEYFEDKRNLVCICICIYCTFLQCFFAFWFA